MASGAEAAVAQPEPGSGIRRAAAVAWGNPFPKPIENVTVALNSDRPQRFGLVLYWSNSKVRSEALGVGGSPKDPV